MIVSIDLKTGNKNNKIGRSLTPIHDIKQMQGIFFNWIKASRNEEQYERE
jgi:hypothetical protein